MTFANVMLAISTLAGVVAAYYAVLAYHRPKGAPVVKPSEAGRRQSIVEQRRPQTAIPIVAALIAWAAVAAIFIHEKWFSPEASSLETDLSPENARIDARSWQKVMPTDIVHQYGVNVYLTNGGKSTALGIAHLGTIAIGGPVNNTLIDALFLGYKAQLRLIPRSVGNEIRPRQEDVWFTVGTIPEDPEHTKALNDGSNALYVFNLMRYHDNIIADDKYIYTENCQYYIKEILHYCEAGHNRSYIAN